MFDCHNLTRSEWENLINEWVFKERDREILKRRLLDGKRYWEISEEFDITERHLKHIVYTSQERLLALMQGKQH